MTYIKSLRVNIFVLIMFLALVVTLRTANASIGATITSPVQGQIFSDVTSVKVEGKATVIPSQCDGRPPTPYYPRIDIQKDGGDWIIGVASVEFGYDQVWSTNEDFGTGSHTVAARVFACQCGRCFCVGHNSCEADTSVSFSITTTPTLPDLVISLLTVEPNPSIAGHLVKPKLQIQNNGNADAGPFQVDWYANPQNKPSTGQIGDLSVRLNGLAAGKSVTVDFGMYTYVTPGTYQTFAQIDTKQEVIESNEANNVSGPKVVEVKGLIINNLTPTDNTHIQGNQVTISATASSPLDVPIGEKLHLDLFLDSRNVGSQESTTTTVSIAVPTRLPALAVSHTVGARAYLVDTQNPNHPLTSTSQIATFYVTQKLVNSSYLILVSSLGPPYSQQGQGAILGYDARTGVFIGKFGDVCNPADLTYGPDGNLYVADNSSDGCTLSTTNPTQLSGHVKRIDGQAGKFQSDYLHTRSPEQAQFGIGGLAFGPDGKLYVSNSEGNRIYRFTGPTSSNPGEVGLWDDKRNEGFVFDNSRLSQPTTLHFGPDNNLYVRNDSNETINRYFGPFSDHPGNVMDAKPFIPRITADYELNRPLDFVFGSDNNLFINDINADKISSFQGPDGSEPGRFISQFMALTRPSYLAFGPDGDLYIDLQVPGNTGSTRGIYRYNATTGKSKGLFISFPYKLGPFTFSSTPVLVLNRGDFDNSACVDVNDMRTLTDAINIRSGNLAFDLNGDMKVDIADARKLVLLFTNPGGISCP